MTDTTQSQCAVRFNLHVRQSDNPYTTEPMTDTTQSQCAVRFNLHVRQSDNPYTTEPMTDTTQSQCAVRFNLHVRQSDNPYTTEPMTDTTQSQCAVRFNLHVRQSDNPYTTEPMTDTTQSQCAVRFNLHVRQSDNPYTTEPMTDTTQSQCAVRFNLHVRQSDNPYTTEPMTDTTQSHDSPKNVKDTTTRVMLALPPIEVGLCSVYHGLLAALLDTFFDTEQQLSCSGYFFPNAEPEPCIRFRHLLNPEPEPVFTFGSAFERVRTSGFSGSQILARNTHTGVFCPAEPSSDLQNDILIRRIHSDSNRLPNTVPRVRSVKVVRLGLKIGAENRKTPPKCTSHEQFRFGVRFRFGRTLQRANAERERGVRFRPSPNVEPERSVRSGPQPPCPTPQREAPHWHHSPHETMVMVAPGSRAISTYHTTYLVQNYAVSQFNHSYGPCQAGSSRGTPGLQVLGAQHTDVGCLRSKSFHAVPMEEVKDTQGSSLRAIHGSVK
ncbi:hypothetical protein C8R46DRAFT_1196481 [Mycena filopes]|nr:hypothetical protein C8R46DRAFT_1196481 [Mycena filopes]